MFKQRSWQHEVLDELRGSEGNLSVRLTAVPCLRDALSGDRKYAWRNFGHDFLMALHDAVGGARYAHDLLSSGSPVVASVRLEQGPAIGVELSGKPSGGVGALESDIADALISAFGSKGLKP